MKGDLKFNYMMLSRLQMDADYYNGNGERSPRVLYYGDPIRHYNEMVILWENLTIKPEWLTVADLQKYKTILLEGKK